MKRILLVITILCAIIAMSSCSSDRTYYQTRNGRIRSARTSRGIPWFTPLGSGYNKPAKRVFKNWKKGY